MPVTEATVAAGLLIGYARCSTDEQDLTAQREALIALGVEPERTYIDQGLTGTNRDRPGLREALAAVRAGDTLVVPKLDRLARSVPDARDIGDSLAQRGVKLSLGGTIPAETRDDSACRARSGVQRLFAMIGTKGDSLARYQERASQFGRTVPLVVLAPKS